jgi:hypothetical protein
MNSAIVIIVPTTKTHVGKSVSVKPQCSILSYGMNLATDKNMPIAGTHVIYKSLLPTWLA